MIRLLNAYFPRRTFFLGISEGLLIGLAFIVATIARLGATDASVMLSYEQGFLKVLVVAGAFVLCMYYFDLYDSAILSNRREVLSRLVQVLGTACLVLAVLYYVYPPLELGRGIFLIGTAFVAVVLFLWRRLFLVINSASRFADRVLILGDGLLAEPLSREISQRPELALNVIGHISEQADGVAENWSLEDDERVADLPRFVRSHKIDRIIVAMSDRKGKLPIEQLLAAKSRGVLIQDATEVYEAITGKVPLESLRLGWLLFSPSFSDFRFVLIYKRLVDVLVSMIGLLLSLLLVPFIALAIKLSSPGPIPVSYTHLDVYKRQSHSRTWPMDGSCGRSGDRVFDRCRQLVRVLQRLRAMYRRFYGLTRNPFELSPDPYFFYPTPLHNEAFAILNYCVLRRKGFVVVTGEVGTGKTLLLRCLLDALNHNQIASALVYNPRLSVTEFLAYVLTDLQVPFTGRTKGEMLSQLNNYLLHRSRRGTTTVLIVDEAHLLNWELLEEIQMCIRDSSRTAEGPRAVRCP